MLSSVSKSGQLTFAGVLGFITGCFILFTTCNGRKSNFHEIEMEQPVINAAIMQEEMKIIDSLDKRINLLTSDISLKQSDSVNTCNKLIENRYQLAEYEAVLKLETDNKKKDTLQQRIADLKKDTSAKKKDSSDISVKLLLHRKSLADLQRVRHSGKRDTIAELVRIAPADTTLIKSAVHFTKASITQHSLDSLDSALCKASLDNISFIFKFDIPRIAGEEQTGKSVSLKIQPFENDLNFFSKYPAFGIWALSLLLFCTVVFMVIAICIDNLDKLFRLRMINNLPLPEPVKVNRIAFSNLATAGSAIILFVITTALTYYDNDGIKGLFFFCGVIARLDMIAVIGYVAAALCFAQMITIVKMAQELHEEDPATDKSALKHSFDYHLYGISLLLALLVFSTGTLYSAVDSLPFVQMLKKDMGFSPAPYDFVLLYGAIHTALVLLFYFPAKIELKKYIITVPPPTPNVAGAVPAPPPVNTGFFKPLGDFIRRLLPFMVASAPLIAGFINWVLDTIFGKTS